MAYAAISKPSLHFDGKTYLGSSSAVTVTGLGFQPDLVWVKDRDNGNNHVLVDVVRGAGKFLQSNLANAEVNNSSQSISAFTSDGFTTGNANPANEQASTTLGFMSWNWLAGNSSGSANNDGSIATTVSVNQTAGCSIFTFTGTGSNGTLGHGLNAVPEMYIIKRYDSSNNWRVYHKDVGNTKYITLETTEASQTSSGFANNTSPTSSVISVGNLGSANASGGSMLCYAFAPKKGYSKFGKYTGNGNANGTFVHTGFKPAFIMLKKTNDIANWMIHDDKRLGYNVDNNNLKPNTADVEATADTLDILSNGFKLRTSGSGENNGNFVYMAFAAEPLVANVGQGIPATAR